MGLVWAKLWSLFSKEGVCLCVTSNVLGLFETPSFLCVYMYMNDLFSSEHKLIIVGLDNAGKTTILYQLWDGIQGYWITILLYIYIYIYIYIHTHSLSLSLMNEVVHTSPTIGSNVEEVCCVGLLCLMVFVSVGVNNQHCQIQKTT